MTKHRYDLYLNTARLGIVHAADVVVVEEGANLRQVGFRYLPDYLAKPAAFPVDPVQLPLMEGEIVLNCRGGAPAGPFVMMMSAACYKSIPSPLKRISNN